MCPFQDSLSVQTFYIFPVLTNTTKGTLQLSTGRKKFCMFLPLLDAAPQTALLGSLESQ